MRFEIETERQEKLWETSKFLGRLLAFGAVFQLILWLRPDTTVLQELLAGLNSTILSVLSFNNTWNGVDILIGESVYRITQDCLGWKSVAAFTALVGSSKPGKNDLQFLAAGIAGIAGINVVRILTTIVLAEKGIISFDIVHGFLWRWGLTAVTVGLWLYWFKGRSL